jgi:predicted peptidase
MSVLFFFLSGCARSEVNTTSASQPTVVSTSDITIEGASESAPPPESPPNVVLTFSAGSIEPGEQLAFSFKSGSGEEIEFLLSLPKDYNEGRDWPLILSLHGFLGANDNLESVRSQNPLFWVDPGIDFPFIVLAPKAPEGSWAKFHEPMEELINFLGESIPIDMNDQFLTGLSASGISALQWALAKPERFTGLALVASGLPQSTAGQVPANICLLKNLPILMIHSKADEWVPFETSVELISALEACGSSSATFMQYEDLNHAKSISTAYAGPELYEWMMDQS